MRESDNGGWHVNRFSPKTCQGEGEGL
jgi:hypothetical protein